MDSKSIKVVLVCHFSNESVRKCLPLDDRKLYSVIRRLLGLPMKGNGYVDIASWDTNLIDNLSVRDDVELFVISAHSGLKESQVHFSIGNVQYWFLRCEFSTMMKHFVQSPALWHKLNPMRPRVHRIIRGINPDIVALIGAENAYISGTVLGLENEYPVIIKTQTIYNNPKRAEVSFFDPKNSYVEKQIFNRMKYFSVTTKTHCDLFRIYNKSAYNLKWSFATSFPGVSPLPKEFDFVTFAMSMSDKKGYHDSLRALAIVKAYFPDVKLNLVGGGTDIEINAVKELVEELDLSNNVVITPLFPKQKDMFQHIQKSRFALLPCKLDYVASTIRQAMYYQLPVICYKTEGTSLLNVGEERVLIAENGDYKDLASKMLVFLMNPDTVERLRKSAKAYADLRNDNERIAEQIVSAFKAVIAHFKYGSAIPKDLLYD